jgi:hypothetical protein
MKVQVDIVIKGNFDALRQKIYDFLKPLEVPNADQVAITPEMARLATANGSKKDIEQKFAEFFSDDEKEVLSLRVYSI